MTDDQRPRLARVYPYSPAKDIRARHRAARIGLIRKREELELSRPELAGRINVCRHYVFAIEIGTRDPSLALMQRWARALGNAPLDLFMQAS